MGMPRLRVLVAASCFGLALAHAQQQNAAERDDQVTTRVTEALMQQGIANADIHVETNEGIVQLSGFVSSDAQKEAAELAASNVKEVAYVQNGLIVHRGSTDAEQQGDRIIADKVREHLIREVSPDDAAKIAIHVQDGIVQLAGFVDSVELRDHAAALARNIEGVREVRNSLSVTR